MSEDKEHILNFAQAFLESGDLDEAIDQYKKILAMDPNDAETHQTLGTLYSQKNSTQLSYESYNKAVSFFLDHHQLDNAIMVFKKIGSLDSSELSDATQAQIRYAQGYVKIDESLKEENLEPAIELIGKILKFNPENSVAKTQLAILKDQINLLPASIPTYQTLGDAFFKNNMLENAQEMFKKITDIDPQNPAVRLHLAQVYLKQGSQSEAKKEYLNLAEESYAKGNINQAFEFAQKAIELKSVEAHYISGLVYFKHEKFEEAVTEFEILLRFKTNHLSALIHLGKSLDVLGRLEKARSIFKKALEMDNENSEVQEAWIDFCIRIKDIDQAIPNLKAILEKVVTGNNAEQIAKFSKLMIRLEPDDISTHIKLIKSLETLGDETGTAEALYRLAMLYERKKQFEDAVECLEKALVLSPANAHTLEKALIRIDQKENKDKHGATFETENPIIFQNSDFWGEFNPLEANVGDVLNDAPSSILNSVENPFVLASLCVQNGYFKAAIEIYQQMLETNPGAEDVRMKLTEVSALYLKKLTSHK